MLKQRVFVVDDEQTIAETLAAILQRVGFAATFFTNPLDALQSARTDPPDLLISDMRMPQLSGIDLALQIKELCPNCKILLLSGQGAKSDLLQAAGPRARDFRLLSKPIHPADLLREMEASVNSISSRPLEDTPVV